MAVDGASIARTPDEHFEDLPGFDFAPNYLDLSGELAGLRMHYIERGSGDPILLVHGEPTWSYLYRTMIPELASRGRALAPDLVGFGRSDKVTDRDWYSYDRHCDALRQFIEQLDLVNITIVVHDWGGPIGLRLAVEQRERFARLVILNTGIFRPGPNWPSPAFLSWREFAESNPDLPVGMIIQGATYTDVPDEVIAAYEAPYPDIASKAGASCFPSLVPLNENSPGAAEMVAVAEALSHWDSPALVAFSDSDPIFPSRSGQKLAERIPGARFVEIEGASHFLQEDKGEEIATHISRFLEETPRA